MLFSGSILHAQLYFVPNDRERHSGARSHPGDRMAVSAQARTKGIARRPLTGHRTNSRLTSPGRDGRRPIVGKNSPSVPTLPIARPSSRLEHGAPPCALLFVRLIRRKRTQTMTRSGSDWCILASGGLNGRRGMILVGNSRRMPIAIVLKARTEVADEE